MFKPFLIWPLRVPSSWFMCPVNISSLLPFFWYHRVFQANFVFFPSQAWTSHFSRSPGCCSGKWYLEVKIYWRQCAWLGPLSRGLAVYSSPALPDHSGVSLSIVVTPLTKRNLVATICSVFIWSKNHCYLLQDDCPPCPGQALASYARHPASTPMSSL